MRGRLEPAQVAIAWLHTILALAARGAAVVVSDASEERLPATGIGISFDGRTP